MSSADVAASASILEATLAQSTGVLCWSTSSSETTTASSKTYSFTTASDGIVIRIPGPQVCSCPSWLKLAFYVLFRF